MRRVLTARVVFSIALSLIFQCASNSASAQSEDDAALAAVTHDLCHRQIVMLGESATHEDGHTHAFKVALVERLVDECGFDGVFFEASHFEFIHFNQQLRAGQRVTADEISHAVGGLWEFNQEFQPLVPFLLAKAQSGRLSLGGIDDQLGQYGQNYANDQMITELAGLLPPQQSHNCTVALHKRIYGDYTDAAPYSEADRSKINSCLAAMQSTAVHKTTDSATTQDRLEMISAIQRWISRDFIPEAQYMPARDRSMFQNFEWLHKQQPRRHKVIVWAATVHIAKKGDPTWGDHTGTNFGLLVRQKFGARTFSLGFSALAGSYRQGSHDIREMPQAPPESVEAQALQEDDADATYVDSAHLKALGTLPGAFFRHSYQTLPWSTFLDGVVVFRQEHPPAGTK